MEFYTENHIKQSRKPHRCHICECEIPVGSSYYRESGMYGGEFFDRCTCKPCARIRNDYLSFYETDEYDNDGIRCYVQDWVCYDCPQFETCGADPLTCQTVKARYLPSEDKTATYTAKVTTKEEDQNND